MESDKPVTTLIPVESDQSFVDLINWFNRWLEEPLSSRDILLIAETVDYCVTNKVKRYAS